MRDEQFFLLVRRRKTQTIGGETRSAFRSSLDRRENERVSHGVPLRTVSLRHVERRRSNENFVSKIFFVVVHDDRRRRSDVGLVEILDVHRRSARNATEFSLRQRPTIERERSRFRPDLRFNVENVQFGGR